MSTERIILPDFLIADFYKDCLVDLGTSSTVAPVAPVDTPEESIMDTQVSAAAVSNTDNSIDIVEGRGEIVSDKPKLDYLGGNAKNIAIVVNEPGNQYLKEDDLTFLTNILKACQLNLADIAIINIATQPVDHTIITEQLKARHILLFEVEPSAIKLPFMIPAFQLQNYSACTVMVAPSLGILNQPTKEGKLLKTRLWAALKQIFGIS